MSLTHSVSATQWGEGSGSPLLLQRDSRLDMGH